MSSSAYRDHPVRAVISRILEMQGSQEFADPSVSDNEQYAFARDKVFAMAHAIQALLQQTPAELVSAQALSQLQAICKHP